MRRASEHPPRRRLRGWWANSGSEAGLHSADSIAAASEAFLDSTWPR